MRQTEQEQAGVASEETLEAPAWPDANRDCLRLVNTVSMVYMLHNLFAADTEQIMNDSLPEPCTLGHSAERIMR